MLYFLNSVISLDTTEEKPCSLVILLKYSSSSVLFFNILYISIFLPESLILISVLPPHSSNTLCAILLKLNTSPLKKPFSVTTSKNFFSVSKVYCSGTSNISLLLLSFLSIFFLICSKQNRLFPVPALPKINLIPIFTLLFILYLNYI